MRKRRVYFGPPGNEKDRWWDVNVTPAKEPVEVPGPLKQGRPGRMIGCGISTLGRNHPEAFPHPCLLVAVTTSGIMVVDKVRKNGDPSHAVLYKHPYGWFVLENDHKNVAKIQKEDPNALAGPFFFSVPKRPGVSNPKGGHSKKPPRHYVPRGCLQRAKEAGFINAAAESQLHK